jgi:hypothetical protein
MRNDYYPTRRKSGLSRLLNALGVLFALIILIAFMDKAGVKIVIDQEQSVSGAGMLPQFDTGAPSAGADNPIVVNTTEPSYRSYKDYSGQEAVRPYATGSQSKRTQNVEEWVARFASTARAQAIEKGVPAGVALAVGIEKISGGTPINDWHRFIEEVTIPLVAIKQAASKADLQAYYKYSANSSLWVSGLASDGRFPAERLHRHLQKYELHAQDKQVLDILSNGGRYEQEAITKSVEVGDEVASDLVARRIKEQESSTLSKAASHQNSKEWEQYYDEVVGKAVAKEIARKKLKKGEYLSEDDMESLIEETNQETSDVIRHNISFLGRKINKDHQDAENMLDITQPKNAQAREELYQQRLKEQNVAGGGN